ncbi:MAG: GNAT family N-acetyltransferase [Clostridia bacterium]|nr:GNAT family N-acetyltransferase [Clostridia bacterium]
MIRFSIEDEEGMEGWPYDAVVPVVFVKSAEGIECECTFGAYPILRAFLAEYGASPFSKEALTELDRRLKPYLDGIGCRREGGILRYYRSFVLWDKAGLNEALILPSSVRLTSASAGKVKVNRTDFDLAELLAKKLPTYITTVGNELVSLASVNEASEGQRLLELTVYTRPAFRGSGYASSNAAALTKYLLEHGKGAVYVTSCRNRASLRLVRRLGFRSESRFYAVDAYRDD